MLHCGSLPKWVASAFQFKIKGMFTGLFTIDLPVLRWGDPVVKLLAAEKVSIV